MRNITAVIILFNLMIFIDQATAQKSTQFKIIAFYTERNDAAHISFVNEANHWFTKVAKQYGFSYQITTHWQKLNVDTLSNYQLVIFLDSRPDEENTRLAFKNWAERGGGWMGFHFSAFALNNSEFPQNWDWYHNEFIGAGSYVSNTWRPTSAILQVEKKEHPAMKYLPGLFLSAPNEWYRWTNDLRENTNIEILASIHSSSFPLGTGPKLHEIWQEGYYPVVWTNKKYNMIYFNMGHNDIDYEHKTLAELSHTFGNATQDQLILNALLWLLNRTRTDKK
jgi:hypothetical protein